jgi:hypothetical protein
MSATKPGPGRIPSTPLLRHFRSPPFSGDKGATWGEDRLTEAKKLLAAPHELAACFEESVEQVEREYSNYQPFYPREHVFGVWDDTKVPHGDKLRGTVDVAERLSRGSIWHVANEKNRDWLDFRYLDREIVLIRARPKPTQEPTTALRVDLLLGNARDRTPILAEVKIKKDQCALYALIQLLTQAAYAVTPSQRERLVLFGSRPEFVLREVVPDEPAPRIDLYVLLVEPPDEPPYKELLAQAVTLSKALIREPAITSRVRRIAWIKGVHEPQRSLSLHEIAVASSRLPRPAAANATGSKADDQRTLTAPSP